MDNLFSTVGAATAQPLNGKTGASRKCSSAEGSNGHTQSCYRPRKRQHSVPPKNALVQLNEMKPGLQYKLLSQTGPVHTPVFVMAAEVNGQLFEGSGPTKKKAKLNAAEKALQSLLKFEGLRTLSRNLSVHTDFTLDQTDFPDLFFNAFEGYPPVKDAFYLSTSSMCTFSSVVSKYSSLFHSPFQKHPSAPTSSTSSSSKNPATILNELQPGLKYDFVSESGESHSKNFVVSVTVNAQSFQGSGRNKRLAKARAARAALSALFNMQLDQVPSRRPVTGEGLRLHPPQVLADTVFRLVTDEFGKLTDHFTSPHARRKVLAGVVMTTGRDLKEAQVICVATGSKCINGEYTSERGLAMNDCHAEIVVRRSLIRFLYSQLEHFLSNNKEEHQKSIFIKCDNDRGFRLKENIQFHLYISTAPCGDARIFSPHDAAVDEKGEQHPDRKTRGQLRSKIHSGEGTVPVHSSDASQTWEGVHRGERLLTMSCSDKIARWNVVGVQGSLLNHFAEPIYLSSIILGSLYHAEHLCRAAYQRISPFQDLPESFSLNRPLLSGISNVEARQPGKAPHFSVNWTVGDQGLEVINAITGRDDLGQPSRLCKHALYRRWLNLHRKLSSTLRIQIATPSSYYEAKKAALDYHLAKETLFRTFQKVGLGVWLKKPVEQDQFENC